MKLIIEIPEKMYHMINAGFYDYGDMNVIIQNGTPIPDNATNGEVIKAIFPNTQTREDGSDFITYTLDGLVGTCVENAWWNSPYQKGDKE